MLKRTILSIALIMTATSAQAGTHTFDARSTAMGGIGASSADYLTAAFHNPALVARYNGSDDVGLLLPYVGAQVQDPDNMVDQLEDFSDLYDQLGSSSDPNDIQNVVNALSNMQGDTGYVQAGVGAAIAIPNSLVSFSIYGKAYADGFVLTDIHDDDLDENSYISDPNYELQSKGVTLGVSIVEFGVAMAKSFELEKGTFYLGVTPKYQQVNTINYVVEIDNYEFDDWDDDRYQNDDGNFNADIGVAYAMDQGFVFGLVGKNLIKQEYNAEEIGGIGAKYVINPVYTASASFNHSLFTVGLDVDLNESERYENFTGFNVGEINSDSDNTQMAGIGAEFNAWDWAQVRVGYQYDIADTLEDQLTAGLGFSPFGVFHVDLSASYAGDDQFGASVQTAFTF